MLSAGYDKTGPLSGRWSPPGRASPGHPAAPLTPLLSTAATQAARGAPPRQPPAAGRRHFQVRSGRPARTFGPVPDSPPMADWQALAEIFSLGRVLSIPGYVARGAMGEVWRFETSAGRWAVKWQFPWAPAEPRPRDVAV